MLIAIDMVCEWREKVWRSMRKMKKGNTKKRRCEMRKEARMLFKISNIHAYFVVVHGKELLRFSFSY